MQQQSDAGAAALPPAARLRQLQHDLQSYLLGGHDARNDIGASGDVGAAGHLGAGGDVGAAGHLGASGDVDAPGHLGAIADAIVDAPPLPVADRLAIYGDGYRVRLIEALDDTYPLLHVLEGDEAFVAIAGQFVAAYPSVHRSIRWYGRELPEFLRLRAPYAAQPILSELALLEWTLAAFSAVDSLSWSELVFEVHPSLRRLDFLWNTAAAWRALKDNEAPPFPLSAEHPVPWLLWRQGLQNYFRSMPADEAAALEVARHGGNFGRICEALAEWLPREEIPLRAASLAGLWADSGIIVGIG
jgi:hypothetical protein